MTESIVVGLGGNVGSEAEIVERFRRARDAFAELGEVTAAPLYRTAPIGPAQAAFLNSALRLRIADVQPSELIATVLEIEHLLGRDRRGAARFGPRPIDLDVLVWGDRVIAIPGLEVPHPRLLERRFALEPLVALAGEAFEIPGAGAAGALLARVGDQQVELVDERW
ncbi:MAG: 2-amino-4-hydroxy-6-hydroxymethyldihydropteridine diphosphokinase [Kofleriaceae bacterium]